MIIYRIQDAEGRGPFRPGLSAKWLDPEPKPHEDKLKPLPEEFPEVFFMIKTLRCVWHVGCGCESPEQLRLWFSPMEVKRMRAFGLRPVKMEVDEILARSDVQLLGRRFIKPMRVDVEEFDLYPEWKIPHSKTALIL